ncbi:MAG: hypothetical protein PHE70_00740 [Tepidanaerobacteraceae bacterium]|nr:hypothetical protein [Tepidanaerobacteraceae bacterium]
MIDTDDNIQKLIKDDSLVEGIAVVWGYPYERQIDFYVDCCEDLRNISVKNIYLKYGGRFLRVSVNLSMICSGRKIVIGVILQEKVNNIYSTIGFRVNEIISSGSERSYITNLTVDEFCFQIPEINLCNDRYFRICIIAHYSSFDM